MTHTTKQLEKMLADATPAPRHDPHRDDGPRCRDAVLRRRLRYPVNLTQIIGEP